MDQRDRELARNLVGYSVRLAPGENILIEIVDEAAPLAREIISEVYRAGGFPFLEVTRQDLRRAWLMGAAPAQLDRAAAYQTARMREMQAYIGIRGPLNASELGDVPGDKMQLFQSHYQKPINDIRIPRTKWCVLRYPTAAMAQLAEMSLEAFTDFYYRVCCLDYAGMSRAMDALVALMSRTDQVRILGPGTDLSFSIKALPVIKCAGELNLPDGEVFTAPVRESVNGCLTYNTPAEYQGFTYRDIRLEFESGRIVKAAANDPARLNAVFDTDEGARYIGEFALGVNPYIERPMKESLFDEKIKGSFHFTPGMAYDDAFNGNRSAIHWDLVCIQTPEFGGGEIYFDGILVRKDGRFVRPELEGLNPERLG